MKNEAIKTSYTATSKEEAWKIADSIFPTDYEYDSYLSSRSGYPVYPSTSSEYRFAKINDLNARLEVVLEDYTCINIWIEEEEVTEEEIETLEELKEEEQEHKAIDFSKFRIIVSNEDNNNNNNNAKEYTYSELIDIIRRFMSGGRKYEELEIRIESACDYLLSFNFKSHGDSVKFFYGGCWYEIIYYYWKEYDRVMNKIN